MYVGNDPVNRVDPSGLADVFTDMDNGTTTFDPRPEDADGEPFTIETRNGVDSQRSLPGADDPYSTPNVTVVDEPPNGNTKSYGPNGAYLDTGDPRGRDIHGGGSCSKDPTADRQGWCVTLGCTRAQNEDLIEFNQKILQFQKEFPGTPIPYTRK